MRYNEDFINYIIGLIRTEFKIDDDPTSQNINKKTLPFFYFDVNKKSFQAYISVICEKSTVKVIVYYNEYENPSNSFIIVNMIDENAFETTSYFKETGEKIIKILNQILTEQIFLIIYVIKHKEMQRNKLFYDINLNYSLKFLELKEDRFVR